MTTMAQRAYVKKILGEIEDRIIKDVNSDRRLRSTQELLGLIIYEATTFETDEPEVETK